MFTNFSVKVDGITRKKPSKKRDDGNRRMDPPICRKGTNNGIAVKTVKRQFHVLHLILVCRIF